MMCIYRSEKVLYMAHKAWTWSCLLVCSIVTVLAARVWETRLISVPCMRFTQCLQRSSVQGLQPYSVDWVWPSLPLLKSVWGKPRERGSFQYPSQAPNAVTLFLSWIFSLPTRRLCVVPDFRPILSGSRKRLSSLILRTFLIMLPWNIAVPLLLLLGVFVVLYIMHFKPHLDHMVQWKLLQFYTIATWNFILFSLWVIDYVSTLSLQCLHIFNILTPDW